MALIKLTCRSICVVNAISNVIIAGSATCCCCSCQSVSQRSLQSAWPSKGTNCLILCCCVPCNKWLPLMPPLQGVLPAAPVHASQSHSAHCSQPGHQRYNWLDLVMWNLSDKWPHLMLLLQELLPAAAVHSSQSDSALYSLPEHSKTQMASFDAIACCASNEITWCCCCRVCYLLLLFMPVSLTAPFAVILGF